MSTAPAIDPEALARSNAELDAMTPADLAEAAAAFVPPTREELRERARLAGALADAVRVMEAARLRRVPRRDRVQSAAKYLDPAAFDLALLPPFASDDPARPGLSLRGLWASLTAAGDVASTLAAVSDAEVQRLAAGIGILEAYARWSLAGSAPTEGTR